MAKIVADNFFKVVGKKPGRSDIAIVEMPQDFLDFVAKEEIIEDYVMKKLIEQVDEDQELSQEVPVEDILKKLEYLE